MALKVAYKVRGSALSCAHMGLTPSSLLETGNSASQGGPPGTHAWPLGFGDQEGQPLKVELMLRPQPTEGWVGHSLNSASAC